MHITILVKQVYWYIIAQVSGEHLQDHWSSGYVEVGVSLQL